MSTERAATEVVTVLQQQGYLTYWAGGCVRDFLLNREPTDYDIATAARPSEIADLFPGALEIGKAFAVMRVKQGDSYFDVATFRHDGAYHDGRHPETVTFSDPESDAERRDFSINALFYDPVTKEVLDFVGGQADLEIGVIRCVGNPSDRFTEDHLRLLRAVRFASVLGFTLESATREAIREGAPLLTRLSTERVMMEFTRLLLESRRAGKALALCESLNLLQIILPELIPFLDHDAYAQSLQMLNMMSVTNAHRLGPAQKRPLAWATLLTVLSDAKASSLILERLRASKRDREATLAILKASRSMGTLAAASESSFRRETATPTFRPALELHRLQCLATEASLEGYYIICARVSAFGPTPTLPEPWISGHDLMAEGIPAGPAIAQALERAYDAQLDGTYASREALLSWITETVQPPQ